jgi:hypothetical protein
MAMSDDKEPMQASGQGGVGAEIAEEKDPPSAGRPDMQDNAGQSGGGAYPHGHKPERFHGGQSDQAYYGDDQLGDKQLGENENATSEDE